MTKNIASNLISEVDSTTIIKILQPQTPKNYIISPADFAYTLHHLYLSSSDYHQTSTNLTNTVIYTFMTVLLVTQLIQQRHWF